MRTLFGFALVLVLFVSVRSVDFADVTGCVDAVHAHCVP